MGMIEKIFEFGNSVEIDRGYAPKFGVKGEKREKRYEPTKEEQKKHNQVQAEKRLRRLIKNNFTEDDWHLTLTYAKDNRPSVEQAHKNLLNFLNRVRRYCKKQNYTFKYISVTEYENKAIHHHIVINGFPDVQNVVKKKWKYNTNWSPIFEMDKVEELSGYLIKETEKTFREGKAGKQRYSCSRNLERPEPDEVHPCSKHLSPNPRVPKKYRDKYVLDEDYCYYGISAKTGWPSQTLVLRRMTPVEKERWDKEHEIQRAKKFYRNWR